MDVGSTSSGVGVETRQAEGVYKSLGDVEVPEASSRGDNYRVVAANHISICQPRSKIDTRFSHFKELINNTMTESAKEEEAAREADRLLEANPGNIQHLPSELTGVEEQVHAFLQEYQFRSEFGYPNPTIEQLREIGSYFPGSTGIHFIPPFVTITWETLPSRPWPLTVGKLPLYYATSGNVHSTPTFGRPGKARPIFADMKLLLWEKPSRKLMFDILTTLDSFNLGIKLFGWCGARFYAEVTSCSDGERLPCSIGGLLCVWRLSNWSQIAREITPDAMNKVVDESAYDGDLKPGVLLISSDRTRMSTSGVPLIDKQGHRFVTCANHGFPNSPDVLTTSGKIGSNQFRFPIGDIALIELEENLKYSCVSFNGKENGVELKNLVGASEVRANDDLYFDSPFNGKCKGIVACLCVDWGELKSILNKQMEKKGGTADTGQDDKYPYIDLMMLYFGNGTANDVVAGSCGSAVWNENSDVVGFFRYYDTDTAIAYIPGANCLVDGGYTICQI